MVAVAVTFSSKCSPSGATVKVNVCVLPSLIGMRSSMCCSLRDSLSGRYMEEFCHLKVAPHSCTGRSGQTMPSSSTALTTAFLLLRLVPLMTRSHFAVNCSCFISVTKTSGFRSSSLSPWMSMHERVTESVPAPSGSTEITS